MVGSTERDYLLRAELLAHISGGSDWTLELHLEELPAPLVMVFRDRNRGADVQYSISQAVDGQAPERCWEDDNGATVSFRLRRLVAMRLAPA